MTRAPGRLVDRLVWLHGAIAANVANRVWRPWLRWRGADLGQGVQLLGRPIVSIAAGGRLRIGDRVTLCSASWATALGVARPVVLRVLSPGAAIDIGADCGLSGTVICAASGVRIGPECLFGADVKLMDTDFHPLRAQGRILNRPEHIATAPITIGRNVFIGTGSMVLKGVSIGDNAVIGAGSVVTRDVPANCIAAGQPARIVGRVPDAEPLTDPSSEL